MNCSIPENIYPKYDGLKSYIETHISDILSEFGEPDYSNDDIFQMLGAYTTDPIPWPDARFQLDPYVVYANCVVGEFLKMRGPSQTAPSATPANIGQTAVQAQVMNAPVVATGLIAPSQYAIPNLYTLRTLDDFYRAFWVAKGKTFETYNRDDGERFFLDEVRFELTDNFFAVMSMDTSQMPELSAAMPGFLTGVQAGEYPYYTPEQARVLLSQAAYVRMGAPQLQGVDPQTALLLGYLFGPSVGLSQLPYLNTGEQAPELEPQTAEMLGYLYAYDFARTAEANNGVLPDSAYSNYNPNLSKEDMIAQHHGEAYIIERIQFAIAGMWVSGPDSLRSFLTVPKRLGLLVEADVIPSLRAYLGPNATLDDWIKLYNKVYEEYVPWEDAQWLAEVGEVPPSHKIDVVEAYEASVAWDVLRQVVYDPSWSPAEEARLLDDLLTQIKLVPYAIMEVNISFVRGGLLRYYLLMRDFHNWRVQMKALVDEVETRLMNEDTPGEKLGQALAVVLTVGSAILSIFFEPLDWILSIIDLLQGDFSGVLFNLLPLIPGAVAKLGRFVGRTAGTAIELTQDMVKRLSRVDDELRELKKTTDAIEQSTSANPVIANRIVYPEPGDRVLGVGANTRIPDPTATSLGFDDLASFETNIAKQPFTQEVLIPPEFKMSPWRENLLKRIDPENIRLKAGEKVLLPVEVGGFFYPKKVNVNGVEKLIYVLEGAAEGITYFEKRGNQWYLLMKVEPGDALNTGKRVRYVYSHYHTYFSSFSRADVQYLGYRTRWISEMRAFTRNGTTFSLIPSFETILELENLNATELVEVLNNIPEKIKFSKKAGQSPFTIPSTLNGKDFPLVFDYVVK